MSDRENYMARACIERDDDWCGWIGKIPFVKFPSAWEVQPIPPFAGAMVRFRVKLPSGLVKSIYLDCFDRLGCVGRPYWEVHPYRGDCARCDMERVDELLEFIANEEPEAA